MAPPLAEQPSVLFTAHSHQILSNCIHLLGIAVLSYCVAHYIPSLGSFRLWTRLSWGRLCVILLLLDSWLFIFFTGVLVNGVGLSYSQQSCALSVYACISFYALSKVFIYAFLVEKVYIVWTEGNQMRRFRSPAYRISAFVMLGYVIILVLMIVGRNSWIREDGICVIGLKNFATIPMISYDLFLNMFLTVMFIWPLWRSTVLSHTLRRVAIRTLYGALVSLTTSAANIAVLTILKGKEYGWVCLGSCVTDVALNAITLSWVVAGPHSRRRVIVNRMSGPPDLATLKLGRSLGNERAEPPLPESYDYLPRNQLPQPLPQSQQPVSRMDISKRWFKSLRPAWRRYSQQPSSMAPLTGISVHVMQSISLSEEVAPGILQATSDENDIEDIPRDTQSAPREHQVHNAN